MIWILVLSLLPSALALVMSCYSNASLDLLSRSNVYGNVSYADCYCVVNSTTMSGFQYSFNTNTCHTFGYDRSPANIRVTLRSQVCFTQPILITSPLIITTSPLSPTIANISTSIDGNNFYRSLVVNFKNVVTLTFLSVIVTVQKTLTLNNPRSYDTIGSPVLFRSINETNTTILYSFTLNGNRTLSSGQWALGAQFDLNNQVRNTSNDTFSFQIGPTQVYNGYF